jgi:hypothetical protein
LKKFLLNYQLARQINKSLSNGSETFRQNIIYLTTRISVKGSGLRVRIHNTSFSS